MMRALHVLCALGGLTLVGCLLPASERVELDREVGRARAAGIEVKVAEGLAAVRELSAERLELWAQAPAIELDLASVRARRGFVLDVYNAMPEAVLSVGAQRLPCTAIAEHRAACRFTLDLGTQETLSIAPVDAQDGAPYAFGVLSDIQRGVDQVQEVFARMNEDPELRFIVSTGDLANIGTRAELERVQRELGTLRVPFFSTVGNHEMGAPPRAWHELFGAFNFHFGFKGVAFSLVDSANATIDPEVYDWLDGWLAPARSDVHVVLTHVPPLDPVGIRGGGFRSRKEAAKLLAKLGGGRVDVLLLGHIHSYYAFSTAGVPTYLSGGGGAIQERLDGIERHYLKLRVSPSKRVDDVAVVRVD